MSQVKSLTLSWSLERVLYSLKEGYKGKIISFVLSLTFSFSFVWFSKLRYDPTAWGDKRGKGEGYSIKSDGGQ